MHSGRQPEAAIVTYCHTVGENTLGLNRPHHHYQIIQEVSISNDLHGTEDDVLWAEQYDQSNIDSDEEGEDVYGHGDTRTDTTYVQ